MMMIIRHDDDVLLMGRVSAQIYVVVSAVLRIEYGVQEVR